jgi:hypothetical protein
MDIGPPKFQRFSAISIVTGIHITIVVTSDFVVFYNESSKLLLVFLPNTDRLQQVEDYVRGCRKLLKYLPCILPAAQLCFIFMPTYKYPIASVSPYDKNSP